MYMFNMQTPCTDLIGPKLVCLMVLHIFSVDRESTSQSTCSIVTKHNAYILYL